MSLNQLTDIDKKIQEGLFNKTVEINNRIFKNIATIALLLLLFVSEFTKFEYAGFSFKYIVYIYISMPILIAYLCYEITSLAMYEQHANFISWKIFKNSCDPETAYDYNQAYSPVSVFYTHKAIYNYISPKWVRVFSGVLYWIIQKLFVFYPIGISVYLYCSLLGRYPDYIKSIIGSGVLSLVFILMQMTYVYGAYRTRKTQKEEQLRKELQEKIVSENISTCPCPSEPSPSQNV